MSGASLRRKLREATQAAHMRLHRHPALSAAAAGKIDLDGYRALLARLYGFHRAFEVRLGPRAFNLAPKAGVSRSELLASDLAALGLAAQAREALPLCAALPSFSCDAEILGALYVVEGSALGGAQIARALKPVLEPLRGEGCRFFSSDGAPRGWDDLLARIEQCCGDPDQEPAVIRAAVATFDRFEGWMTEGALDPASLRIAAAPTA